MSEREYQPLHAALVRAQQERGQRREWEDGELGWVRYERQVMTDTVNLLRSRRGLGPVSEEAVLAAERQACGHVDYTMKYALGCENLVLAP